MTKKSLRSVVCLPLLIALPLFGCKDDDDGGSGDGTDSSGDQSSSGDTTSGDGGATTSPGGNDGSDTTDDGGSSSSGGGVPPADWCLSGDTVLAQTVQSLSAGQWAELPANASLDGIDMHYHLTAWADSGVWNPVTRRVQWVGGPGSCCADPASFRMLVYDVASDTWQIEETPWVNESGHAYDCNALDPTTGRHYFARGGGSIRFWDGADWSEPLPGAPFYHTIAPAITWFRDLNQGAGALIHVSSTNLVGAFDGQTWEVVDPGDTAWGGYHMFAEYNPVHQVVWLGAGNDGVTKHAKLTPALELVQLQDAPIGLNSAGSCQKTYDPQSGMFIVLNVTDDVETWWEFDITTDTWQEITTTMQAALPESWGLGGFRFIVPIDDCGVTFLFRHQSETRQAYIYKHSE